MSETTDAFDELEAVVRREFRETLEAFDAGIAEMQSRRDQLKARIDDFAAYVEAHFNQLEVGPEKRATPSRPTGSGSLSGGRQQSEPTQSTSAS